MLVITAFLAEFFVMRNVFRWIFRIILLLVLLAALGLIIACLVINFTSGFAAADEYQSRAADTGDSNLMALDFKAYAIRVTATGKVYVSDTETDYIKVLKNDNDSTWYFVTNWNGIEDNTDTGQQFPIGRIIYDNYPSTPIAESLQTNKYFDIETGIPQSGRMQMSYSFTRNEEYTVGNIEPNIEIRDCELNVVALTGPSRWQAYYNFSLVDASNNYLEVGTLQIIEWLGITTDQSGERLYYFNIYGGAYGTWRTFPPATKTFINPNTTAFQTGYEAGYNDGYAQGETAGYQRGWNAGYEWGYDDGLLASGAGTGGAVSAAKTLIRTVWQVVNVPIFGDNFTLGTLLAIAVVLSIVLFVLKIVRG